MKENKTRTSVKFSEEDKAYLKDKYGTLQNAIDKMIKKDKERQ